MKILFLDQLVPYPLDSGVKFRSYFMLRKLAAEHEVTLACFSREDNTEEQISHLRSFCREVHTVPMVRSPLRNAYFLARSLALGRSFIIERDTVPAMQALVDRLLREAATGGMPFDVIHSDQLWMAQYALRGRGRQEGAGPAQRGPSDPQAAGRARAEPPQAGAAGAGGTGDGAVRGRNLPAVRPGDRGHGGGPAGVGGAQ